MNARRGLVGVMLVVLAAACGDDAAQPDAAPAPRDGSVLPDAFDAAAVIDAAAPDTAIAPDTGGGDQASPADGLAEADGAMCLGPIPGCTGTSGGMCDPVCQARCGCQQRCAVVSGMSACVPPAPDPVAVGEKCMARADTCQAGSLCLEEPEPVCGDRCYRFCRSDADCKGGASCSIEVQFASSATTFRVCSPPAATCDPTGPATCDRPGAPPGAFACYVASAANPDTVVCDCAGRLKVGEGCMYEHECAPGLECMRVSGVSTCRPICKLKEPGGCPPNSVCSPMGTTGKPSTLYGFCAPV